MRIYLVGGHEAEFRGIVLLHQINSAVGVESVEIRAVAEARTPRHIQLALDVAGHARRVGAVVDVDADSVAELVHETQIPDTRPEAPGSGQSVAQHGVPADDPGAERAEAGKAASAFVIVVKRRQALGTVAGIAVVAAEIPAVNARRAPVQLVASREAYQP